ncbi:MAG TPA: hypothetical protein VKE51_05825 [Vicinamibacterales bacterium]|nr:hypothetical protein [Vicinamibacterales bacterium]
MNEETTPADRSAPLGTDSSSGCRSVEVSGAMVRVHGLCIERATIVAYLARIAPEKQEIALVHALEVGVTELIARRERFQR